METQLRTEAETGIWTFEVIIVLLITGLFIALAMPSLTGYQGTSALRAAARQFASDVRAAQQHAVAQGTQNDLVFATAGGAVTGYSVTQSATVLWQVTLSPRVHATTTWPGNDIAFTSIGSVVGPGSTPALCIDNRNGGTIMLSVVLATGRVLLTQGAGSC